MCPRNHHLRCPKMNHETPMRIVLTDQLQLSLSQQINGGMVTVPGSRPPARSAYASESSRLIVEQGPILVNFLAKMS